MPCAGSPSPRPTSPFLPGRACRPTCGSGDDRPAVGRRFAGDVAGVMAELLATDARTAAAAASGGVNVATWDALRYLAARGRRAGSGDRPVPARSGGIGTRSTRPGRLGHVGRLPRRVARPRPGVGGGRVWRRRAPAVATPIGLAGRERRASGGIGLGRVRGRQSQGATKPGPTKPGPTKGPAGQS